MVAKTSTKLCKRKIEFYWLYTEDDQTKSNLKAIFDLINELPCDFSADVNRFYAIGTDKQNVSMRFNTLSDDNCSGVICYTRKDGFPSIDSKGEEKPLKLNSDDDGLLEKGHFLIMPWQNNNRNGLLLIFERSLYAPNIVILYKYLTGKFNMNNLQIHRLTKTDVFKELSNASGFVGLDFKYSKSLYAIENSVEYVDAWKIFDAMKEIQSQTFSVILSSGRKKQEPLNHNIVYDFINICKNMLYKDSIHSAKVKYLDSDNRSHLIDIMAGDIVEYVSVAYKSDNSKSIDSEAMYKQLHILYNGIKDRLKEANTISVLYNKDDEQDVEDSEENV